MDFFFLKKILGGLLMPMSLIIFILLIAIFFYKKKPTLSFRLLLTGTAMLIAFSNPIISKYFMLPLEGQFQAFQKSEKLIDYIIVLGGYHADGNNLPATTQLSSFSLTRLVEAIRIANLHPEATIIMSGGTAGEHNKVPHAQKMKEAAILLGVSETRIKTQEISRDTEDEARNLAPVIKNKTSVLITNADHMQRAINFFNAHGLAPIPAPASFWVKPNRNDNNINMHLITPSSRSFHQTTTAWYETLGLAWQWLKELFE